MLQGALEEKAEKKGRKKKASRLSFLRTMCVLFTGELHPYFRPSNGPDTWRHEEESNLTPGCRRPVLSACPLRARPACGFGGRGLVVPWPWSQPDLTVRDPDPGCNTEPSKVWREPAVGSLSKEAAAQTDMVDTVARPHGWGCTGAGEREMETDTREVTRSL